MKNNFFSFLFFHTNKFSINFCCHVKSGDCKKWEKNNHFEKVHKQILLATEKRVAKKHISQVLWVARHIKKSLKRARVLLHAAQHFYVSHTRLCVRREQICCETDSPMPPTVSSSFVDKRARIYETAVFMYKYVLWELFFYRRVWSQSWQIYVYNLFGIRLKTEVLLRTRGRKRFLTVCSGFIICTRDFRGTLSHCFFSSLVCTSLKNSRNIHDTCEGNFNLLPKISAG